jgi:hypothetical protein
MTSMISLGDIWVIGFVIVVIAFLLAVWMEEE